MGEDRHGCWEHSKSGVRDGEKGDEHYKNINCIMSEVWEQTQRCDADHICVLFVDLIIS